MFKYKPVMATYKEKKFWIEFFELYKSKPELWKVKHEDYKNRTKKDAAYKLLIKKCREVEPTAGKDFVTKRINSFRTVYKRELKRYYKSLNSGEGGEYVPSLWYFQHLDFLKDQDEETAEEGIAGSDFGIERGNKESEQIPKRFKPNSSTDELVRLATQRLRAPQDSCHQLAIVWADKLSKMGRNQRIIAEKVINEVMFNGELGLLNFNTTLTNLSSVSNLNSSSTSITKNNNLNSLSQPITKNNLNSSSSTIKKSKTVISTSESSQESPHTRYAVNYVDEVNDDGLTDQESIQSVESYIVAEYDPLDESVKLED